MGPKYGKAGLLGSATYLDPIQSPFFQLKVQLAELSEANHAQTTELRKLLDTGIEEIEHSIATFSETSHAEFQSRFKALDEQFRRWLDELSQQDVARTEALAESLRHRIDLGVTALIEGSREIGRASCRERVYVLV